MLTLHSGCISVDKQRLLSSEAVKVLTHIIQRRELGHLNSAHTLNPLKCKFQHQCDSECCLRWTDPNTSYFMGTVEGDTWHLRTPKATFLESHEHWDERQSGLVINLSMNTLVVDPFCLHVNICLQASSLKLSKHKECRSREVNVLAMNQDPEHMIVLSGVLAVLWIECKGTSVMGAVQLINQLCCLNNSPVHLVATF